jgi:hypothetical protein
LYIMKTFGNLFRWTYISRREKVKPKFFIKNVSLKLLE